MVQVCVLVAGHEVRTDVRLDFDAVARWRGDMKRIYEKPVLSKRGRLASVTAVVVSEGPS